MPISLPCVQCVPLLHMQSTFSRVSFWSENLVNNSIPYKKLLCVCVCVCVPNGCCPRVSCCGSGGAPPVSRHCCRRWTSSSCPHSPGEERGRACGAGVLTLPARVHVHACVTYPSSGVAEPLPPPPPALLAPGCRCCCWARPRPLQPLSMDASESDSACDTGPARPRPRPAPGPGSTPTPTDVTAGSWMGSDGHFSAIFHLLSLTSSPSGRNCLASGPRMNSAAARKVTST